MPRKIQEPEVQEDSEYSEEPTPPVKPKKKMSDKQLEILRQGRLKAIQRRKEKNLIRNWLKNHQLIY